MGIVEKMVLEKNKTYFSSSASGEILLRKGIEGKCREKGNVSGYSDVTLTNWIVEM